MAGSYKLGCGHEETALERGFTKKNEAMCTACQLEMATALGQAYQEILVHRNNVETGACHFCESPKDEDCEPNCIVRKAFIMSKIN